MQLFTGNWEVSNHVKEHGVEVVILQRRATFSM